MRPIRSCQWLEDDEPCINIAEGTTDYCASHNHAIRKAARVQIKVIKEVKRITEKRAKQNREYLKMREDFLIQYPVCQVKDCQKKAVHVHHEKGRANDLLTNPEYFMAICEQRSYRRWLFKT